MQLPRRSILRHRSRAEWVGRIALFMLVAVLAYQCVTFSLGQVIAKGQPALAYRLAPYDGRIAALYASSLASPGASSADRVRADEIAGQALERDPTAVAAIATLGLDAQVRGDAGRARQLFSYAQKLTRRDLRTQLWSIEDAVGRGNVREAIGWYDVTLRTSPEMGELLFPILASASSDPAIQAELIPVLARRAQWSEHFLNFIPGAVSDPRETATFFQKLARAGVVAPERARAATADTLLSKGYFEEAWAYYASLRPGSDRQRSRDPNFRAALGTPTSLDWVALNDGGLTATIQDGGVEFTAPSEVAGPMLRQNQLLSPGRYHLVGRSSGLAQAANELPYWALSCQGGKELGRVTVSNSNLAQGEFSGTFVVPSGCSMQVLTLFAQPSNAPSGMSGRIDQVQLAPAR